MEWNDIYDENRNLTGRVHLRGTAWEPGEYGLVVCVWVHDGGGRLLMTRRSPEKTFSGTWENSGGAAKAGESSRAAVARELFEETGIRAPELDFEYLGSDRDENTFYDFYCLENHTPVSGISLLPGETDQAAWVAFSELEPMMERGEICLPIAKHFREWEWELQKRQTAQD